MTAPYYCEHLGIFSDWIEEGQRQRNLYAPAAPGPEPQARVREVLGLPEYQVWINLGLALFCVGLLGSARTWWEMVLWGILAAAFLIYAALAWRTLRTKDRKPGKDLSSFKE